MLKFSKHFTNVSRHIATLGSSTATSSDQTLCFLIEKCSSVSQLKTLHAQIILQGLTTHNLSLSKLISSLALSFHGHLPYAYHLFDTIPQPNRHMFNTLIRASASTKSSDKAILLYKKMVCSGIFPNEFTFPFILKACAFRKSYVEGSLVHLHAFKLGFSVSHTCVQNGLINFYVGCGKIELAWKIFDYIEGRTIVSWNSMIGGYAKIGMWEEAFSLFGGLRVQGLEPDGHTFVNLLSVCSKIHDAELGRFVHWCIEINGVNIDAHVQNALLDMYAKCGHLSTAGVIFSRMANKNVVSWTSMINAYAKHGLVDLALTIFNKMPVRNVISWNSMISCYVQNGYYKESLELFYKMCDSGVVPDETTIISAFSACSHLGNLSAGKKLHEYVSDNFMKPTVTLYNSLLAMYAKCGSTEAAHDIFLNMSEKNIISWNIIINALALHGYGYNAIELFKEMETCSIQPDAVTFNGLLSACCHCGLIEAGRNYFNKMGEIYKVDYDIEHYACMIDILGRGGLLEEAIELVGKMTIKPDVVIWGTLLGSCRIHRNIVIAKLVLKQVLELEEYSGGVFVLMANIFCEAQQWDDVKKLRKLMKDQGVRKSDAVSSIVIGCRVSEFMVDDKKHEASDFIYAMADQLTDQLKYERDDVENG